MLQAARGFTKPAIVYSQRQQVPEFTGHVHHQEVEAARRRRDAGVAPLREDNALLLGAREGPNPLPVPEPREPWAGSKGALVLPQLPTGARTLAELACSTGLDEWQVRRALGNLRRLGHGVRCVAAKRFYLLPAPLQSVA